MQISGLIFDELFLVKFFVVSFDERTLREILIARECGLEFKFILSV